MILCAFSIVIMTVELQIEEDWGRDLSGTDDTKPKPDLLDHGVVDTYFGIGRRDHADTFNRELEAQFDEPRATATESPKGSTGRTRPQRRGPLSLRPGIWRLHNECECRFTLPL
jgi:hypothetical protein